MTEKPLSGHDQKALKIAIGVLIISIPLTLFTGVFSGFLVNIIENSDGFVKFFTVAFFTVGFLSLLPMLSWFIETFLIKEEDVDFNKYIKEKYKKWEIRVFKLVTLLISILIFLGLGGSLTSVVVDIIHFWQWMGSWILVIFNYISSLF